MTILADDEVAAMTDEVLAPQRQAALTLLDFLDADLPVLAWALTDRAHPSPSLGGCADRGMTAEADKIAMRVVDDWAAYLGTTVRTTPTHYATGELRYGLDVTTATGVYVTVWTLIRPPKSE